MTVKRCIFVVLLVIAPALAIGGPETAEHRYLVETFGDYGAAVERCERLKYEQPAPDHQTLAALNSYGIDDNRVFLVGREYHLSDQCTKDELLSLLLAVMSLQSADLEPVTQQALEGIRGMVFSDNRWHLEKQYRALPAEMKKTLEALPYFQTPFDSLSVIDRLED